VRNPSAHVIPWILVAVIGAPLYLWMRAHLDDVRAGEAIVWQSPRAAWLVFGALLVGTLVFHLRRHHAAAFAFTRVSTLGGVSRGVLAYLVSLPGALRVLALISIAAALGRPQTYRTVTETIDSIDVMVVFDLSRSMVESDMAPRRDRFDAAQYVVRQFVAQREGDRVGLAIFAQGAMLQCPLTTDMKVVDWIVADLKIGDVPESGTAIGDGLGMALGELRKSDAKSKVVVLLSDGDNNVVTAFTPDEAAQMAARMGVKVFTVLVGSEGSDYFGGMSVNPETMRSIARDTDGRFFRATDLEEFSRSFDAVRRDLDKDKRTITRREPDKELFLPMIVLAALLLAAELILAETRFRRFP
jgi:Ca-activated chloride channel homolog